MSRRCDLTGKGVLVGHKVSHSNIKTKRRFLPNLLNVTMISDTLGRSVKLKVSANALKTVDHRGGLDAYLLSAKNDVLAPKMRDLKKAIQKKQAKAGLKRRRSRADPDFSRICSPPLARFSSFERELQQQGSLQRREIVVGDQRQHQRAGGVAVHRQAFHVVDLVAHVGEDQLAAIDQRAGLDRSRAARCGCGSPSRAPMRSGAPAPGDCRRAWPRNR